MDSETMTVLDPAAELNEACRLRGALTEMYALLWNECHAIPDVTSHRPRRELAEHLLKVVTRTLRP